MASRSPNGLNHYTSLSENGDAIMVHHNIDIPEERDADLFPCIYKIPKKLRKVNPEAYTPQFISIGPLHHGNRELLPMEKEKQRYFDSFSNRVSRKQVLHKFKSFVRENEEELRRFYSEELTHLSSDMFVNAMQLDSIFIMELFIRESESYQHQEDDNLFRKPWMKKAIQQDLLLLENQLPLSVLENLYGRIEKEQPSFIHLACKYFADYDPRNSCNEMTVLENCKKSKHFTDLIRNFQISNGLRSYPDPHQLQVLKCATKLYNAGVIFRAVTDRRTLDMKVEKKLFCVHFKVPQLRVHCSTECVFRNLIALEQCHYTHDTFICNYISVIDNLINTAEDVDLLVDKEVIVHHLGNNREVATLINGLRINIVTDSNSYKTQITHLNAHYDNAWNHTVAKLWTVYFKDHWRGSSTIVGIAVLFFTFFNFFRAILK